MSDENSQKILISKLEKRGVSRTIGSGFGFGSWTIGETSIELQLDPPIDLTTEEGQDRYKKIKTQLFKMCKRALDDDVQMARESDRELDASIVKREMLVRNAMESSE